MLPKDQKTFLTQKDLASSDNNDELYNNQMRFKISFTISKKLVGLLLLFDEFQLIFSHFSFSFFPNRSKLILNNIFGRLQKLFIVNLLFSVKVDHIIRHIALIHPRNKQLLLQFKMLLVMFFPLLFSTYRWLYLFYATSQHFILFLELLLFLVNQKQRLFNRRISFFTFLSHFNQQSIAIINIQKANQHLFILYLPQSLFFQQGFIFIIKRLTFPFRCDYFIGISWVIEMLVVRLLLLVQHHRISSFVSVRHYIIAIKVKQKYNQC